MPDGPEEEAAVDDRALHEHVLDAMNAYLDGGGMVTAFHLIAEYIDTDGDESWMSAVADGQGQSRTLGLISWAQRIADHEAERYLESIEED